MEGTSLHGTGLLVRLCVAANDDDDDGDGFAGCGCFE